MTDERRDPLWKAVREQYNPPTDVPREEMWQEIEARMGGEAPSTIDLAAARRARERAARSPMGWAAAAAAVLILGIGIGRMTKPTEPDLAVRTEQRGDAPSSLQFAASEHFGRSEWLLTMMRADARRGSIDPGTGVWARELLTETRLLIDARTGDDPVLDDLLEDLELILAQVVGVAETRDLDEARSSTELQLALRGMEDREVLARLRATPGTGLSGT